MMGGVTPWHDPTLSDALAHGVMLDPSESTASRGCVERVADRRQARPGFRFYSGQRSAGCWTLG